MSKILVSLIIFLFFDDDSSTVDGGAVNDLQVVEAAAQHGGTEGFPKDTGVGVPLGTIYSASCRVDDADDHSFALQLLGSQFDLVAGRIREDFELGYLILVNRVGVEYPDC